MNLMAYPSAEKGLSDGLRDGIQTGLAMRKQQQDEKTAEFQKQKYEENQNKELYVNDINKSITMMSSTNSKLRQLGAESYLKAQEKYPKFSGMDEEDINKARASLTGIGDNHLSKVTKEAQGAINYYKKTRDWNGFKTAIDDLHMSMAQELSGDEFKQGQTVLDKAMKEGMSEQYLGQPTGQERLAELPADKTTGYPVGQIQDVTVRDTMSPDKLLMLENAKSTGDYSKVFAPEKQVERTVDLGNEVEYIYTDGTREKIKKGVSPNAAIRIDTGGDFTTRMADREFMKQMPKAKKEAFDANEAIGKMSKMKKLLDSGTGGSGARVQAWAAPILDMLGYNSKGLDDASLYDALAQGIAGSLRMQTVGGGQVTEYEQRLLQKVSGGGRLAPEAAKELVNYYMSQGKARINEYNAMTDDFDEIVPKRKGTYRKINPQSGDATKTQEQEQVNSRFTIKEIK